MCIWLFQNNHSLYRMLVRLWSGVLRKGNSPVSISLCCVRGQCDVVFCMFYNAVRLLSFNGMRYFMRNENHVHSIAERFLYMPTHEEIAVLTHVIDCFVSYVKFRIKCSKLNCLMVLGKLKYNSAGCFKCTILKTVAPRWQTD